MKVAAIPGKFAQVERLDFRILNIRLGLMQKYITLYTSLPEFAKYVVNMKGPGKIMRISRVCATMGYNFGGTCQGWQNRIGAVISDKSTASSSKILSI